MNHSEAGQATRIECQTSESFVPWLAAAGGSLAVSTYQAGKLALIGWDGRQVTLLMRDFDKPMGIAVEGRRMALACRNELILLANDPALAHDYLPDQPGRYDALYLPRAVYRTGDLNVHDVSFAAGGALFCATRLSCLAAPSEQFCFEPRWQPPFITELAPEDRCHLNGLAMRDGDPAFVTALGQADMAGGWRADKAAGGVVMDVARNEIGLRGLSMPHSPRWHEGRLWLLNSGAGELWVVDPQTWQHSVVCCLPGYLRGLCFIGSCAVIGLCQIRETNIFGGLPVQARFRELICGVAVVDLASGQQSALFEFTAGCHELYDVQFLSGVERPTILNLQSAALRDALSGPSASYWLRADRQIPAAG